MSSPAEDSIKLDQPARILVIDDVASVLRMVRVSLSRDPIEIVEATNLTNARAHLEGAGVDLVLTDLQLPDGTGLDLAADLERAESNTPVILMTAYPSFESAVEGIRTGLVDYLQKPVAPAELRATVIRTLNLMHSKDGGFDRQAATEAGLSEREIDVAGLICAGLTAEEAAGELSLSSHTVRNHLKSVYRKLEVHNRAQLVGRLGANAAR